MTRTSQRGFSLVEITVVLAVVAGLLLIVYSMIDETLRATMFNESHNDLTILTQRAVNALQLELAQSRQVFQEDADGAAYRAALHMPAGYARSSNTLLPILHADPTRSPASANAAIRSTGKPMLL